MQAKIFVFILLFICGMLMHGISEAAQTGATMPVNQLASGAKNGPIPMPDLSGLDEYTRQLVYASRNIEEGDWTMAMNNLQNAAKLRTDDPHLYEMFGIVHDSDREPLKAFENFRKAADMYFNAGNIDKAWKMLGWMRTFDIATKDVDLFENRLRERQVVINKN